MENGADDELLTVDEVAARLKVNPETVRRWLRTGLLRGARIGSARGSAGYRIAASDVAQFLRPRPGPPSSRK